MDRINHYDVGDCVCVVGEDKKRFISKVIEDNCNKRYLYCIDGIEGIFIASHLYPCPLYSCGDFVKIDNTNNKYQITDIEKSFILRNYKRTFYYMINGKSYKEHEIIFVAKKPIKVKIRKVR